jgi:hypothetical protein
VISQLTSSALSDEQLSKLRTALSAGPVRPFLVTLTRTPRCGAQITVHVARECIKPSFYTFSRSVERGILRRISAVGLDASVRVKLYRRFALDTPRSLEAFVAEFGRGERIYDPTGVFEAAESLIGFAHEVRRHLSRELKGVYWSSRWHIAYVVLDQAVLADAWLLKRDRLIAAEQVILNAYETNAGPSRLSGTEPRTVKLCFALPGIPVVPVDKRSTELAVVGKIRVVPRLVELVWSCRVPLLTAVFGLGSASMAVPSLPAFDNGAMQPAAGAVASAVSSGPISYGDEADHATAVSRDHENEPFVGGPGLHLFWRDPIHGTIGQNPLQPNIEPEGAIGEAVAWERFAELSKSGAIFSAQAASTDHRILDLSWLANHEPPREVVSDRSESGPALRLPLIQRGVVAVLGLSCLMQSEPPDEAYHSVLEDVQLHFGLPRSLQLEIRWHQADLIAGTPLIAQGVNDRDSLDRSMANDDKTYLNHPNVLDAQWWRRYQRPGGSSA